MLGAAARQAGSSPPIGEHRPATKTRRDQSIRALDPDQFAAELGGIEDSAACSRSASTTLTYGSASTSRISSAAISCDRAAGPPTSVVRVAVTVGHATPSEPANERTRGLRHGYRGRPGCHPGRCHLLSHRSASSISVSTICGLGNCFDHLSADEDLPLPLPLATPRSASRASPGPLTTHPITATRSGTSMPSTRP